MAKYAGRDGNIMDCGDNSCFFAEVKKGQRTNGGCRCWPPGIPTEFKMGIHQIIQKQRDEIKALKEEIRRLKQES